MAARFSRLCGRTERSTISLGGGCPPCVGGGRVRSQFRGNLSRNNGFSLLPETLFFVRSKLRGIKGAQSSETLTFAGKRFRQRVPAATRKGGGDGGRRRRRRIVHNGRGSLLRIFSIKGETVSRDGNIFPRENEGRGFKRRAIKRTGFVWGGGGGWGSDFYGVLLLKCKWGMEGLRR